MSYLPVGTELGDLRIIEVIEHYDRPLLFACKNNFGRLYLAVLVDDTGDTESWLYAEMSSARWQHVRSGGIDLHDAFAKAESETVYRVCCESQTGRVLTLERVNCEDIREIEVPVRGEHVGPLGKDGDGHCFTE